jgi:hypothetical protein
MAALQPKGKTAAEEQETRPQMRMGFAFLSASVLSTAKERTGMAALQPEGKTAAEERETRPQMRMGFTGWVSAF